MGRGKNSVSIKKWNVISIFYSRAHYFYAHFRNFFTVLYFADNCGEISIFLTWQRKFEKITFQKFINKSFQNIYIDFLPGMKLNCLYLGIFKQDKQDALQ